jgi:hypothetical protein
MPGARLQSAAGLVRFAAAALHVVDCARARTQRIALSPRRPFPSTAPAPAPTSFAHQLRHRLLLKRDLVRLLVLVQPQPLDGHGEMSLEPSLVPPPEDAHFVPPCDDCRTREQ